MIFGCGGTKDETKYFGVTMKTLILICLLLAACGRPGDSQKAVVAPVTPSAATCPAGTHFVDGDFPGCASDVPSSF